MKKILVPCDFSKPAINAFRFALDIACKSKAVVHLLNVIELPAIHDPIIMPVMTFEKGFMTELKQKTIGEFNKLLTRFKANGVTVKLDVEFGSPSRMIADFSKKKGIDLIIMGTHGTTGIREYFIGSNAEKVVRHAKVPVMVMKNYYKGAMRDIVFPNTLETEKQEELISKVKELQAFFKATIHILYVNTPTNFTADNITLERLRQFAKRFMFKNFTLNVYNYPFEESGIIHFTRSIKGNLIAMGTHGRKGISHFLNGSLAEDMVNHADFPIWTYSPR
ncbi:MAG: universal stress protein [Cyclobacteriaceae bacterium]